MDIISLCQQIEDPRMDRRKVHDMATIIYIAVAAVGTRLRSLVKPSSTFSKKGYLG